MKSLFSSFFSIVFLAFVFSSCTSDGTGGMICTGEFVVHHITVLQPDEQPADSVDITVQNEESGEQYDVCQDNLCDLAGNQGQYVIFHDGFQGEISEEQENVIVIGTKDSLGFLEEYSFYDDGCHVRKTAGPDTVYLQQESAGT